VISKYQPSARKLAGWNIFTEVLDCISFVAILFVGCGNRSFHGINPSSLEYVA
jgi:Organic Anion Transporter Polypeptide (OATP) family